MERIQLDDLSAPLLGFVKTHLPEVAAVRPARHRRRPWRAGTAAWSPTRPEPLIATAWLYATARRVLADELGEEWFDEWWLWQVDILDRRHVG